MLQRERKALRETIEFLELDMKFIDTARRNAQAQLDVINNSQRAARTRLNNLEAWVNEQ